MSFLPDKLDKNGKPVFRMRNYSKFIDGRMEDFSESTGEVLKKKDKTLIHKDLKSKIKDKKLVDLFINELYEEYLTVKYYNDQKDNFIKYQKLKNKFTFKPLTLDYVKNHLKEKIMFYSANGEDPNGIFGPEQVHLADRNKHGKVFADYFIPNGDIKIVDRKKKIEVIYKDWFKNQQVKLKKGQFIYAMGETQYGDDMQVADDRQLGYNVINTVAWIEV
jgi:hypothetical protein